MFRGRRAALVSVGGDPRLLSRDRAASAAAVPLQPQPAARVVARRFLVRGVEVLGQEQILPSVSVGIGHEKLKGRRTHWSRGTLTLLR